MADEFIQKVFWKTPKDWDVLACSFEAHHHRLARDCCRPLASGHHWIQLEVRVEGTILQGLYRVCEGEAEFVDLSNLKAGASDVFVRALQPRLSRAVKLEPDGVAHFWLLLGEAPLEGASPPRPKVPGQLPEADFLKTLSERFLASNQPDPTLAIQERIQERLDWILGILGKGIPGSAQGLVIDEFYSSLARALVKDHCEEMASQLFPPPDTTPKTEPAKTIERFQVGIDPVEIHIGGSLVALAATEHGPGPLVLRIKNLRAHVAQEMGMVLPGIRIRDDLKLKPHTYEIHFQGRRVGRSQLHLDKLMALGPVEKLASLEGDLDGDPAFNHVVKWIPPDQLDQSNKLGCIAFDPTSVLCTHLTELVWRHAPILLTFEQAAELVERHSRTEPRLHSALERKGVEDLRIWQVLRELLAERVSIRDLTTILQTMLEFYDRDLPEMIARVREALAPQITQSTTQGLLHLEVVLLTEQQQIDFASSDPQVLEVAARSMIEELKVLTDGGWGVYFLVEPALRTRLRDLLRPSLPLATFLSTRELLPEVELLPFSTESISEVMEETRPHLSRGDFLGRLFRRVYQTFFPEKAEAPTPHESNPEPHPRGERGSSPQSPG